jgi:hypothetical protein
MSDQPGIDELVGALRALQATFQLAAIEATIETSRGLVGVRLTGVRYPIGEIFDSDGNRFQLPQPLDG